MVSGLNILLAEDDNSTRLALAHELKRDGHTVYAVEDGVQGLEWYMMQLKEGEKINVILTDLQMPRMNGHEMVKAIRRADDGRYNPRVIYMSASDSIEELAKLDHVESWLQKPFEYASLQRALGGK